MQLAALRWLAAGIRSHSCTASTRDRRASSPYGTPSASRGTVIVAFNPVREVKNGLRKMQYIHARQSVPRWNEEIPFKALT